MSDDYMGVPGLSAPIFETPKPDPYVVGDYGNQFVVFPGEGSIEIGTGVIGIVQPEPPKSIIGNDVYQTTGGSNSVSPSTSTTSAVKKADPQYVDFNEANVVPITDTELTDLYFEQINGGGLLVLNNRNFVNTGTFIYQPIVNISDFVREYNPRKLIPIQETSDTFFSNFPINLDEKIPKTPTSGILNGTNVYIDSANNIVIETKDMRVDERVEIQVLLDGTIYQDVLDLGTS